MWCLPINFQKQPYKRSNRPYIALRFKFTSVSTRNVQLCYISCSHDKRPQLIKLNNCIFSTMIPMTYESWGGTCKIEKGWDILYKSLKYTHFHTHTHIFTHMLLYIYTYEHILTFTQTFMHMLTRIYSHSHPQPVSHTQRDTLTPTHSLLNSTNSHPHSYIYIHTYSQPYSHPYAHTHSYIYMWPQTLTHMYSHPHIHTYHRHTDCGILLSE